MGQRKKRIEAKAKKRAVRVWKRSQVKEVLPEQKAEPIVTEPADEIDFHPIPPVPDEFRGHYPQPDRHEIHVRGTVALMSINTYVKLPDCTSLGNVKIFPGRVWKSWCPIEKRYLLRFCTQTEMHWATIEVAGYVWSGGFWHPIENWIRDHSGQVRESVATHLL